MVTRSNRTIPILDKSITDSTHQHPESKSGMPLNRKGLPRKKMGRKPLPRDENGKIIRPPPVPIEEAPQRLYQECSRLVCDMIKRVKSKLRKNDDPSRVEVDLIKWVIANQPKQLKKKALSGNAAVEDEGGELPKFSNIDDLIAAATEANDADA